jgi:protein gp37
MSDLFNEDVPFGFINRMFAVMADAHWHVFLILTKRPARMLEWFRSVRKYKHPDGSVFHLGADDTIVGYQNWPLPNVWLGVTAENQKTADERIPILLQIPAAVRFVSCEPLLGPIDLSAFKPFDGECFCQDDPKGCKPRLTPNCPVTAIDWVICGGETGPNARPMHPDWVRSLRDQCQAAGIPFFFKSWGDYGIFKTYLHAYKKYAGELIEFQCVASSDCHRVGKITWHAYPKDAADDYRDIEIMERIGKKRAGRLLDGRTWDEIPGQVAPE